MLRTLPPWYLSPASSAGSEVSLVHAGTLALPRALRLFAGGVLADLCPPSNVDL